MVLTIWETGDSKIKGNVKIKIKSKYKKDNIQNKKPKENNKMIKSKKNLTILLLVAVILLAASIIIVHLTGTATVASASEAQDVLEEMEPTNSRAMIEPFSAANLQLTAATQAALLERMRSDYFTYGGVRRHINRYYSELLCERQYDRQFAAVA